MMVAYGYDAETVENDEVRDMIVDTTVGRVVSLLQGRLKELEDQVQEQRQEITVLHERLEQLEKKTLHQDAPRHPACLGGIMYR
jgi:predicted RNase H-like nuclease (RuvC/YqgF family)